MLTGAFALAALVIVPAGAQAASAPVNTGVPTISPPGTPEVGQTLTAGDGTWTGDPTPTFTYQWQRCEEVTTTTTFPVGAGIEPSDIVLDPSGNAYVPDLGTGDPSSKVFKVAIPGGTVTEVGTTGARPRAIARDSAGNVYTANESGTVTKVSTDGTSANFTIPGAGTPEGYDLALDATGNIYVAVYNLDTVVKLRPDGTLAPGPWPVSVGDGPRGIALDSAGNIYTANRFSNNVSKITPLGSVTASWASTGAGPFGIAIDPSDNVFVANVNGQSITKITSAGTATNPFASIGTLPFGIALDSSGNIYTANPFSDDVSKVTPDGTASILGAVGDLPQAVAVGSGGKVYAANGAAPGSVTELAPGLNCTNISGATASTYQLQQADEGKKVRVRVTGTNTQGSESANSLPTATVDPDPTPSNTSPPTISPPGTPEVGQTLTAGDGTWTGDPTPTFTYQWQRCEETPTPTVTTPFNTTAMTGAGPVALAIDSSNNLYTANRNTDNISRIAPVGTTDVNWASAGDYPQSIAVDPEEGYVYAANRDSDDITVVSTSSAPGATSEVFATGIDQANVVALDSVGNVYTGGPSGTSNIYTVKKYPPYDGNPGSLPVSPTWSVNVTSSGSPGVVSGVTGIEVDSSGTVYVLVNRGANSSILTGRISKISADGSTITNDWATVGADPRGFTLAPDGFIYTSNYGGPAASKTNTSNGSTVNFGSNLGSALNVTADTDNNVYVSTAFVPSLSFTGVRKIEPDGTTTNYGSTGGFPTGIVIDGSGNLFTSNLTGNNLTKIAPPPSLSCTNISGATASTYTLTGDDEGKKIRVRVTGTNSQGSASANSAPTATVDPEPTTTPANTALPTISGTPAVGSALTAGDGTWTGNPAPTFSYQWQRCDASGNNCTDISGATSGTYTPTSADEGKTIRVKVTATNSQGSAVAVSEAKGPVPDGPGPGPNPGPTPSGKPKLGVSVSLPKKARAGKAFTVKVKVRNRASAKATTSTRAEAPTTARNVKTCAKLPKRLFVVKRNRGKVSGRTICWSRSSLAAGKSATYTAKVRSSKTMSGSVRIAGTTTASNSSGGTVKASSKGRIRVVDPAEPRPKPPTG